MPNEIKTTQAQTFKKLDTFKQKKCSHINCRSRLETQNPLREEIQRIISNRLDSSAVTQTKG